MKKKPTNNKKKEIFWVHLKCPDQLKTMNQLKLFFKPHKLLDIRPSVKTGSVMVGFTKKFEARQVLQKCQEAMKAQGVELVGNSKDLLDPLRKDLEEKLTETGRLFIRHLPFTYTDEELRKLFESFGFLSEASVAFDGCLARNKGFGFVTFIAPSDALRAMDALQHKELEGRKIHISAADPAPEDAGNSAFIQKKRTQAQQSQLAFNWNTLFLSADTVASIVAHEAGITVADLHQRRSKTVLTSQLAVAEMEIVSKMRDFLVSRGIEPDKICVKPVDFLTPRSKLLSSATFLCKDLLPGSSEQDIVECLPVALREEVASVHLLPYGISAILTFKTNKYAKMAFKALANKVVNNRKILLQWVESLDGSGKEETDGKKKKKKDEKANAPSQEPAGALPEQQENETVSSKIILRNIPFNATEKDLNSILAAFENVMKIRIPKTSTGRPRGFAFVDFESAEDAKKAKENMASLHLLGRRLVAEYARI